MPATPSTRTDYLGREIPDHVKDFKLTRTSSSSTTYHFRPIGHDGDAVFGWVLATVNDATGELNIQSDWGNWAYRWNIRSLGGDDGKTDTLTAFIGDRSPGNCDYLADKLTSHEQRHVFDAEATTAAFKRALCEARLAEGRAWIEYYDGDRNEDGSHIVDLAGDAPRFAETRTVRVGYTDEKWPLTKALSREIFDALDEILSHDDAHRSHDRYLERYFKIEGHVWIAGAEPWEHTKFSPETSYYQLLYGILPALVEACFAQAHPGRHRCNNPMPREAGAGHWRDWHRGHACHLDPEPLANTISPHPLPDPEKTRARVRACLWAEDLTELANLSNNTLVDAVIAAVKGAP